MSPSLRLAGICAGILAAAAVLWCVAASCLLIGGMGFWGSSRIPALHYLWGWFIYLPFFQRNTTVAIWLVVSAIAPACIILLSLIALVRWNWRRVGGMRGVGQRLGIGRVKRSASATHGDSDYMPEEKVADLYPSYPHPVFGGIVVGELDRVDTSKWATIHFEPGKEETYGNRGKSPLMFDHCQKGRGSGWSLVIGGSGGYKTTNLTVTLCYWGASMVVLDPAGELHAKVGRHVAEKGKEVIRLDLGDKGPNVLEAIDTVTDEGLKRADTRIRAVVQRIIGPMPKDQSGNAGRFKSWGRAIIVAFLADLMYREDVPAHLKTLRVLDAALSVDEARVRDRLHGIGLHSPSRLARRMALAVCKLPEETWGGAIGNAMDDTEWMASEAYLDLVSGGAFKMRDLAKGNLAVFNQIPMEVLESTPAVARVLIGGMLDAVFNARGRVVGRVGFFIDEAVLLGNERSLRFGRDFGRKYKVVGQLFYQSEGQIEDVWGKPQKDAWFDGVSWRSYTVISNTNTAKDVGLTLGTFTAEAESQGHSTGRSGKFMELQSRQEGGSTNRAEVKRDLALAHELLRMHPTERITIVRNEAPIRHAAAIDFTRPELKGALDETDFQRDDFEAEEMEEAL